MSTQATWLSRLDTYQEVRYAYKFSFIAELANTLSYAAIMNDVTL